jgi:hypothetical protein
MKKHNYAVGVGAHIDIRMRQRRRFHFLRRLFQLAHLQASPPALSEGEGARQAGGKISE